MEFLGEKIENLKNSGLLLDEQEKFFFVDEKENITIYINKNGVKCPCFTNETKRKICIEKFLAFHSYEIGNSKKEGVLYLLFNGDKELYNAMLEPEKYKNKIEWRSEFEDELISKMFKEVKYEKSNIPIFLHVKRLDEDDTLYISSFYINSFELYNEVIFPWKIQNKYNQSMIVYLSKFEKDFLLNGEIKIDFYPTDEGLEPIIIDEEKKKLMLNQIIKKYQCFKEENQITVFKFKNGDKDILKAFIGILNVQCCENIEIEKLKNQEYYKELIKFKDPVLFLTYIPRSDKLLYYQILHKK